MITHVAFKEESGKIWSLIKPNRHSHILQKMRDELSSLDKQDRINIINSSVQGFLNDKGEFLDREEAFLEAAECKQILSHNPINPSQRRWDLEPDLTPRQLFSEDIW